MRLLKIKLQTANYSLSAYADVLQFPITDILPSDPYILRGVDGLSSSEVDVSIANTLYQGGIYQGRRPQNKEVVLLVSLNPNYYNNQTPSDMRTYFYGLLTTPDPIKLCAVVEQDEEELSLQIDGYLKKLESTTFDKQPAVQITLACVSPYLIHPYPITQTYPGPTAAFTNIGNAPTGFKLAIFMNQYVSDLTFKTFDYSMTDISWMKINKAFNPDDIIYIDTVPGRREVYLQRGLEPPANLFKDVALNSEWLMLTQPLQQFYITANNDTGPPECTCEMTYAPKYWGV